MARHVNKTDEAIKALGGVGKVAALTGVTEEAVYNWINRGFPTDTYLILTRALNKRGYSVSDALWPFMRGVTA
jgi:hypothetical protein